MLRDTQMIGMLRVIQMNVEPATGGPSSATLAQHYPIIGSTSRSC